MPSLTICAHFACFLEVAQDALSVPDGHTSHVGDAGK
jgi:hypothetical protein